MMPRMSSSRMIRYDSPSILISVPPYFEISTLSPDFTVKSTFLPLSSILPVPRATTLPSCGFSFAVSGIMIPPFFTSVSSIGCTNTRSPSGLTLTDAIVFFLYSFVLLRLLPAVARESRATADKFVFISSCLRQLLQTRHRQRRRCRHEPRRPVQPPDEAVLPGLVVVRPAGPPRLMLVCRVRRCLPGTCPANHRRFVSSLRCRSFRLLRAPRR